MHDALAVADEIAIGEGQPAADLVYVDMGLDPVADLGPALEVGGDAGGRQHRRGRLASSCAIAQRDVAHRHQETAMGAAARVGVLGLDAQPDHERAVVVRLVEERPVVIEERAGAEQRLEAPRRIGVHFYTRSPATALYCSALTATFCPNHASKPSRP